MAFIIILLLTFVLFLLIYIAFIKKDKNSLEKEFLQLKDDINSSAKQNIEDITKFFSQTQNQINQLQEGKFNLIDKNLSDKQDTLLSSVNNLISNLEQRFKTFSLENEQKLDNIRTSVEKKLSYIQEDNNKKLSEINDIVDQKLQKTLDERVSKSFGLVNERLEAVHKGLGEMQNLASSVGDLKKVLSNVKTRGILGEIQLGAILDEILSPEQFDKNVATKKGSKNVVEFAVKIPTTDDEFIYLPIDSKFPADTYSNLLDAYDLADKTAIDNAIKKLVATIKSEAKDISEKYIDVPNTTEFAILFLPFEGLYAEVIKTGVIEVIQRDYRVNIAGPTTMAALLNSLQMGFRTFAIRQRSTEVWEVLGAVKTEFEKFEKVLNSTQQKLNQANDELDKLVGTRTRQIQKKLKDVTTVTDDRARMIFDNSFNNEND